MLIAVAIGFAAAISNAAVVNWNVMNIQSSPANTAAAGWLVQVYSADTVFSYDAAKAGTITALDSATSVASGTIFKASGSFGDYAKGDAVNTYAVVFDAATIDAAKYYIVSAEVDKNINSAGSDLTLGFGNMASTATSNTFRNSVWTATGTAPVPEPTSGLLMLLGMAGLALRRRRA